MAFGREGDHVLVNGRMNPRIIVRSGAPQRWRVVNAAKSRYFEIDMDGSPFHVIGRDGGLQEFPVKRDTLVIAPGERIDAIVAPQGAPGKDLSVLSLLYNRGYGSIEMRFPYSDLLTIAFADLPPYTGSIPEQPRRAITPLDVSRATKATINLTIAQLQNRSFEYGIDGTAFGAKTHLKVLPGETQVWTLVNTTPWSHPFHLHGFFFQTLEESGAPLHPIAWKDTIDVPFKQTVRVAVRFDDDRAGAWMYHCHVLDHAEGGLMGYVQVGDAPAPRSGHPSHHEAIGSARAVP
jgi:FtsP/CotA-like multicopper oxidase with cupredoxin domain